MALPYLTPLSPEQLRGIGVPEIWPFGIADRVRFGEIDALNHVNHTAYLRWFESLRVLYMRERGLVPYDGTGPQLVLKSVTMEYRREMFLAEEYVVTARTASFRTASLVMQYAVFAPDVRAEGTAVLVFLRRDGTGKFPLTAEQKALLTELDGAVDATAPPAP